jgi:hypothetical protein
MRNDTSNSKYFTHYKQHNYTTNCVWAANWLFSRRRRRKRLLVSRFDVGMLYAYFI